FGWRLPIQGLPFDQLAHSAIDDPVSQLTAQANLTLELADTCLQLLDLQLLELQFQVKGRPEDLLELPLIHSDLLPAPFFAARLQLPNGRGFGRRGRLLGLKPLEQLLRRRCTGNGGEASDLLDRFLRRRLVESLKDRFGFVQDFCRGPEDESVRSTIGSDRSNLTPIDLLEVVLHRRGTGMLQG